jgi:hypothetical protein
MDTGSKGGVSALGLAGIMGKDPKALVRLPSAKMLNLHNMEGRTRHLKGTPGSKRKKNPFASLSRSAREP